MPAELGPGPGRVGALIEQQDLSEVVAQAGPGLAIGTGDRSRRSIGSFHDTSAGALTGDASVMEVLAP